MNEAAEKKSSPLKWILLGCGGCGLLGVGFFVVVFGLAMAATGPAADAARLHVTTVQGGDVDGAYDASSSQFKNVISKEEFAAFTKTWPALYGAGAELTLMNRNVQNDKATMSGTTTGPKGTAKVTINLIHENGTWRVLNVQLDGDQEKPAAPEAPGDK